MKITATLLAAVCAMTTPALGFTIPADQPDGVYQVSDDGYGKWTFTKLADPSAITTTTARSIDAPAPGAVTPRTSRIARQCSGLCEVGCFGQGVLNSADTDAANLDLDNQIGPNGHGLGSHQSVFAKRGNTVAYCCNNRSQGNTCFVQDHDQANKLITAKCGWYQSGYAYNTGAHLTYGYRHALDNFCPS